MQLSQKGKRFSETFFAFSISRYNFVNSQKKDDHQTRCICELTDLERRVSINI